jgi:hypothetical protein
MLAGEVVSRAIEEAVPKQVARTTASWAGAFLFTAMKER